MSDKNLIKSVVLRLMQEYKVSAEDLIEIIKSTKDDNSSKCSICMTELRILGLKSTGPVHMYCEKCEFGKIEIHAKIRSKKTIKSYNEPYYIRGHYLRFSYENKTEDNIHLNIKNPTDIELRSGDCFILTVPFYGNRDVFRNAISKEYEEYEMSEVFKIFDQIEISKNELTKYFIDSEIYYRQSFSGEDWKLSLNDEIINRRYINEKVSLEVDKIENNIRKLNSKIIFSFLADTLWRYMALDHKIIYHLPGSTIENKKIKKTYKIDMRTIKDNDIIEKNNHAIIDH